MPVLNESISFVTAPADVQQTFHGRTAIRQHVPAGQVLYKFTQFPLVSDKGLITPFWSWATPTNAEDPGLEKLIERAGNLGVPAADFARARSAVVQQWNEMSGLLRVRLLVPVCGLYGRCGTQRVDQRSEFDKVVFIGGAWQLWIPNLTRREVVEVL